MADLFDVLALAEAKQILSIGSVDTTDDVNLARAVTAVSRRLDELVGPVVQRPVSGEMHNGGYCTVELLQAPVAAVTAVTENGVVLVEGTDWVGDRYKPDPALYDGFIVRRSGNYDIPFTSGRLNVVVSYTAGRYADTATVGAVYREAAGLMLRNLWRSYQESVGQVGEFDTPVQNFPAFAVPNAVRDLLHTEVQPEVGF